MQLSKKVIISALIGALTVSEVNAIRMHKYDVISKIPASKAVA